MAFAGVVALGSGGGGFAGFSGGLDRHAGVALFDRQFGAGFHALGARGAIVTVAATTAAAAAAALALFTGRRVATGGRHGGIGLAVDEGWRRVVDGGTS